MDKLIEWLNVYFGEKAPKMPVGLKDFIVKVAPWLSIIGLVFSLPAILALIGIASFIPVGYGMYLGNSMVVVIFAIASVVLYALAIPGLFKKTIAGWNFVFYATIVNLIQSLVMGNIVNLIIGALICFWILFQIRSYYSGGATPSTPTTPA